MNKNYSEIIHLNNGAQSLGFLISSYNNSLKEMALFDNFLIGSLISKNNLNDVSDIEQLFKEFSKNELGMPLFMAVPIYDAGNIEEIEGIEVALKADNIELVTNIFKDNSMIGFCDIDIQIPDDNRQLTSSAFLKPFNNAYLSFYDNNLNPLSLKDFAIDFCGVDQSRLNEWLASALLSFNGFSMTFKTAKNKLCSKESIDGLIKLAIQQRFE